MNAKNGGPRRARPVPSPDQVVKALRGALKEQDKALKYYSTEGWDGGRHARTARLLARELLAGIGTEIHDRN